LSDQTRGVEVISWIFPVALKKCPHGFYNLMINVHSLIACTHFCANILKVVPASVLCHQSDRGPGQSLQPTLYAFFSMEENI